MPVTKKAEAVMQALAKRFSLSSAAWSDGRARWQALRDLLGGALLLALWLVLWTVTWAAVAGPLSPAVHGAATVAVSVASE
jgi:hypothetical protein